MKTYEFITEWSITDPGIRLALEKKGYTYIGHGADQLAFIEPGSGEVLKIFGTQTGTGTEKYSEDQLMFITWVEYCQKHDDNPYLPRFSGWETFEFNGNRYLQIRMERLHVLPPGWGQTLEYMSDNLPYEKSIRNTVGDDDKDDDTRLTTQTELVLILGEKGWDTLFATMRQLRAIARKNNWVWDLHPNNFMIHADGTPVILDPWAVRKW